MMSKLIMGGVLFVAAMPLATVADASESARPIPGQQFISLHAARNMAAHNRLPQVRASDRFIALKNKDDKAGIPLPMRRPAAPAPEVAAAEPKQKVTSHAQAKQILSIFAPSD